MKQHRKKIFREKMGQTMRPNFTAVCLNAQKTVTSSSSKYNHRGKTLDQEKDYNSSKAQTILYLVFFSNNKVFLN